MVTKSSLYNRVYNKNLEPCNCGSIILELREKLWNTYIDNQKNIDEIWKTLQQIYFMGKSEYSD
jgi:hypothetical protein